MQVRMEVPPITVVGEGQKVPVVTGTLGVAVDVDRGMQIDVSDLPL